MKQTLMQFFEWYIPDDGSLWKSVSQHAEKLARTGFTKLWLPPAYKGQAGGMDVGYGVYDMYDLGEFDQKGSVRTKYGTKDEYLQAIKDLQANKIDALGDIVLNHRMGADEEEEVMAQNVNENNRDENTNALHPARVWTKFTFPGRKGKYSTFQWDWQDFTGTDWDASNNQDAIIIFEGKRWSQHVSKEEGNFDFIMGNDVDFSNPDVINELYTWGKWYTETTGINGFRLDAVKSVDARFFLYWLENMKKYGNHPGFAIGEYWSGDTAQLVQYLKDCGHCMALFDAPLHFHFQQVSEHPENADLRLIFDDTLTSQEPSFACAFSDNHDTQPGQALQSWVQEWFKPHAYALILLNQCELPCVFYGDYYGIPQDNIPPVDHLDQMVWIRHNLLSSELVDYSNPDDGSMLCWEASGDHPVIVILSIGDWKQAHIEDLSLANKTFVDLGDENHTISTDQTGAADFTCLPRGCSVYILQDDYNQMKSELAKD